MAAPSSPAALVESVAKGRPLDGLKKWITVGTPFVALRKEHFLFSRLTLPRKVVLVASLMLLMMFLVYLGGQLYEGTLFGRAREPAAAACVFSAAMMSLPFIFFYTFLKILDARSYYAYRPKVLEEAREALRRALAGAQPRRRRGRAGPQAAAAREAALLRRRLRGAAR